MAAAQECRRAVDVEIPAGEVEREYSRVARDFQKHARIPGFRPGKAPLSIVRRRFQDSIREEVLKALLPAHLRAAWQRENLEPVSAPDVEDLQFQEGQPIRFRASFEVVPQFELIDYTAIKINPPAVSDPTEEDVERALSDLRERHAEREPIDPAADGGAAGDELVQVSMQRRIEDESEFSQVDDRVFDLASGDIRSEFKEALTGVRMGEEREVAVTYPGDYQSQRLAGKRVEYKLRIKDRFHKRIPELNDEFAKRFGVESVEQLRSRVRDELRHERIHSAERAVKDTILDRLLEQHQFAVPESLTEKQIETRVDRSLRGLAAQGIDTSKLQLDWSRVRGAERQSAERDVRISVLLDRIAEKENITAPQEQVESELRLIARRTGRPTEEVRQRLAQNGTLERIQNQIRNERTLDFLYQTATGAAPHKHGPETEAPAVESQPQTGTEPHS